MTATMSEAVTVFDMSGISVSVITGSSPTISFYNASRDEGGLLSSSEALYMALGVAKQAHERAGDSDGTEAAVRLFRLSAAFGLAAEMIEPSHLGIEFWEKALVDMAEDGQ